MLLHKNDFQVGDIIDIILSDDKNRTRWKNCKIVDIKNDIIFTSDVIIDLNNMCLNDCQTIEYIQKHSKKKIKENVVFSIYIPWIHKDTTKTYINTIITNLNWGTIDSIDLIQNNTNYMAFIHFSELFYSFTDIGIYLKSDIGNEIKITYNIFNYWIVKNINSQKDCYYGNSLIVVLSDDSESEEESDVE